DRHAAITYTTPRDVPLGGRGVVGQIRQQLDELAAARDQLELLLQVVTDISSELDLQATLHRIVGAAIRCRLARHHDEQMRLATRAENNCST
ncbi:hypothetical protein, partial [Mycolicibacterium elephantis]